MDGNEKKKEGNTTIFVRRIPLNITLEPFLCFFSEIAPVKHAIIVTDPETKKSKGYGFVSFLTHSDAEKVIFELSQKKMEGHYLKAEFARRRNRNPKDSILENDTKAKDDKIGARRPFLIIRNLPWSIRKKDDVFFSKFSEYGKVINVIIPRKKGGKMSGFAFVHMKKESEAENAIKNINGIELDGRNIAVDWALSQTEWKKFLEKEQDFEEDDMNMENTSEFLEDEDSIISTKIDNENNSRNILTKKKKDSSILNYDNENTIFVRNISFKTTNEALFSHFSQFGRLKYAQLVIDTLTEKSKGIAFIRFINKEDMDNCLKLYWTLSKKFDWLINKSSILQNEVIDNDAKKFVLDGNLLNVSSALNKEDISIMKNDNKKKRMHMLGKNIDKRNIFLLDEGYIDPKSPLYELLSETDRNIRNQSLIQRKKLLEKNPSLYISLTRLSIRNIPKDISDKELKALAREACVNFAKEVKENKRMPLTREEKLRDGNPKKGDKGIVRQAKIIEEKNGHKRGYGFIEYVGHRWALMGLRWLNGRKISSKKNKEIKKRLIVEFALENINVIKQRQERQEREKKKALSKIEDGMINSLKRKRSSSSNEIKSNKKACTSYITSRKKVAKKNAKKKKSNINNIYN
ncbi:hypothetical protein T552_01835 [Pneumocystis carinii B80]|uniref:RRM domain-containing protein n=1 Tax=Pneumocystis carinii (strain B80) TaxID=1408658 RepID=A0A0W4ZJL6_PNEC8|nr:hypothetical protein T552_01835 [Pneumocystis carinii B80]KTW28574.1 hypothetical protein T552_01835 [Pneumocystis carinii B80]